MIVPLRMSSPSTGRESSCSRSPGTAAGWPARRARRRRPTVGTPNLRTWFAAQAWKKRPQRRLEARRLLAQAGLRRVDVAVASTGPSRRSRGSCRGRGSSTWRPGSRTRTVVELLSPIAARMPSMSRATFAVEAYGRIDLLSSTQRLTRLALAGSVHVKVLGRPERLRVEAFGPGDLAVDRGRAPPRRAGRTRASRSGRSRSRVVGADGLRGGDHVSHLVHRD